MLDAGPAACGYEDQRWTLARVAGRAWRRFGWSTRWPGWTCCCTGSAGPCRFRPAGAAERDEDKIARWREDTWPVIKALRRILGAWPCFGDESGQGLRPPEGRTWGRRGQAPVVTVTGGHGTRVSLAALIAVPPGHVPRLIYRTHRGRRGDKRKGFTETDYARFPAPRTSSSAARSSWSGTT